MKLQHIPVLLNGDEQAGHADVLSILQPQSHESVLDVTLGLGGHAHAFLKQTAPDGMLTGLDADEENLSLARESLKEFDDRLRFVHANFRDIGQLDLPAFDIIFADLGVSSPHFDDPQRGFTFRSDAPLDMRYDRTSGLTAAEWLQKADERDIYVTLRDYGELREAKRLGTILYRTAQETPESVATTTGIRQVCEAAFGYRAPSLLPQIFQALRIRVNDELGALEALLAAAPLLLKSGGRFGILTYHSLEDRMVKQTFRALTTPTINDITGAVVIPAAFELLTRKAIVPSEAEVSRNPRARSGKLRALRRVT